MKIQVLAEISKTIIVKVRQVIMKTQKSPAVIERLQLRALKPIECWKEHDSHTPKMARIRANAKH